MFVSKHGGHLKRYEIFEVRPQRDASVQEKLMVRLIMSHVDRPTSLSNALC